MAWRDDATAQFRARHASGEFQKQLPAPSPIELPEVADAQIAVVSAVGEIELPIQVKGVEEGPRQPPDGRKRELDGIDWYEVETATLYEIWPDGVFGGEVEVVSRATGAPKIYGGAMHIPRSEYRGTVEATGKTFIEHDIYAAVRKVARLAVAAAKLS